MTNLVPSCLPHDTALLVPEHWVPSPNFGERAEGSVIDMLLLHYTATPTNAYALELLTSPEAGVSSHYLIDGEGRIFQMVAEQHRAWHAGEAVWAGDSDINSCSIGIEIQNQGAALAKVPAYGKAQMDAVVALCKDIVQRHNIEPHRVLGHSDVAPHRKQDPGAHFDWQRLAREGVGLWFDQISTDEQLPLELNNSDEIKGLQEKLCEIGYGLEITGEFDERTHLVVTAFQRHYRPSLVNGALDRQTADLIDLLLAKIKA